jgi:pimeloyl-ACP methyl ester carboxylesterase
VDESLENRRTAKLYAGVPPQLVARLQEFRARYPVREATVAGTRWRYTDTGAGESAMLLLSGAACIAEISWASIEHYAGQHRVIAPDYPALDTMAALVDGVAGLLDQLGVKRAHVLGGSYGGLVAQVFVRRHPDRAATLILSHTLLPDREASARTAGSVRWMRWLPAAVLRALMKRQLGKLFPANQQPEVALSRALLADVVDHRLTKGQIVSLVMRLVDLGMNYSFTPDDLRAWPGRVLLLMADDDPATPPRLRQAMAAMYPRAPVRIFSGGGHLTSLLKQGEYFAAVDDFLKA